MKFLRILLVFLVLSFYSKGQSNHFVYIQTEKKQPFYIKLNNQILSSTDAGYVIIPMLTVGDYQLVIGFPKNQHPPITFLISINGNDLGFMIQQNADEKLALLNLQTAEIIQQKEDAGSSKIIYETNTDEFSKVLAAATNTTLIRRQIITIKEIPVISNDTAVAIKPILLDSIKQNDKSIVAEIIKLQSFTDSFGRHSTYLINDSITTEIVSIDIDYSMLDTLHLHPSDMLVMALDSSVLGNLCKIIANQQDVDQLEANMKLMIDEEKMIVAAHDEFLIKCFSTEQIKYLCNLFAREDNKCSFLLEAYPFTIDRINFKTLELLLTTDINIKRFTETVR